MKAGRELDYKIACELFAVTQHDDLTERVPSPRPYSTDISAAWEVVEKLGMTLIPLEDGCWFAVVGPKHGWKTPDEFIERLQVGAFHGGGAAVSETAPLTICLAALQALENRKRLAASMSNQSPYVPN